MSYEPKKKFEDVLPSFHLILTEYEPISKAPGLSSFIERSDRGSASLQFLMREESTKQYKSIETRTGDIYLCENPALLTYQAHLFERNNIKFGTITRRKPRFLMSHANALELIKQATKSIQPKNMQQIDYAERGFEIQL